MALFKFMESYGEVKGRQSGGEIVRMLAKWDPQGASEADILAMGKHLDDLSIAAEKARQAYNEVEAKFEALDKKYHQYLLAAEKLQSDLAAAPDGQKAGLEASLTKLLEQLEPLKPELESERADAKDAKEFYDYLADATRQDAEKVKGARATADKAMRDMEKAKMDEERALEKEKAVKTATGLANEGFGTAIGVMQEMTKEATVRADAAKKRAEYLKPATVEEDENIANALKSVSGSDTKPVDLAGRLAALKNAGV